MANTQTTTAEPTPSWLWAVLIVLAILPIVFWMMRRDDSTPDEVPTRSCEIWSEQYAVIPWNRFPEDTLRVGPGEEWLIRLHPAEMSGVVILDPRARNNWTRPTDTAHMLFSDGLEYVNTPGKRIKRGRRNTFRAWGEGCLLVQVSG